MPKKSKKNEKVMKKYTLDEHENQVVENLEVTDIYQVLRIYRTRNQELQQHFNDLKEQIEQFRSENLNQNYDKSHSAQITNEGFKKIQEDLFEMRTQSQKRMKELLKEKEQKIDELDDRYGQILDDKQQTLDDIRNQVAYMIDYPQRETQYIQEIAKLNGQIAKKQVDHEKQCEKFKQNELKQKSIQEGKFTQEMGNIMDNANVNAELSMIGNEINSREQNKILELNLEMNRKEKAHLEQDKSQIEEKFVIVDQKLKYNNQGLQEFRNQNHQLSQKIKTLNERIQYSKQYIAQEIANYSRELENIKYQGNKKQEENMIQMKNIQAKLKIQSQETINILSLVQMIMDQRTDIEEIFLECLDELKKQFKIEKICSTPQQSRSTQKKVVAVQEMDWEMREYLMKLIFSKINYNYQPVNWREIQ